MKATFGAGCFWHVQLAFDKVKGVISTKVGYMGGNLNNPTYEQVCTDRTGHAEVVQVEYNPKKISYERLLGVFWGIHNPTQLNRQGFDMGTQYRSVIFYHNEKQRRLALESKKQVSKKYKSKIVTEIKKATGFYKAEEYHQDYLEKRGLKAC